MTNHLLMHLLRWFCDDISNKKNVKLWYSKRMHSNMPKDIFFAIIVAKVLES